MKKLLNTLYVTTDDAYLSLNGETVDVIFGDDTHKQIPLHTLNGIVSFSYKGASPALMGKCAEMGILLSFYKEAFYYKKHDHRQTVQLKVSDFALYA